jgi:SAM-dependent methyltransferase
MTDGLPALPDFLVRSLESEWRVLTGSTGSGRLSRTELDGAGRALLALQRGLTGGRELVGGAYMDSPEALGAYLLYYWPASFLQTRRALERADRASGPGRAARLESVLDIGAGPGPASAAYALRGAISVTALDTSPQALGIAKRLLSGTDARFEAREWRAGSDSPPKEGGFDLIVLSHSLNELFHDSGDKIRLRADFLDSLKSSLSEDGRILVVEPALLATSRDAIAVRDSLLERGWKAQAPCIYDGPCPAFSAGESQTCHDSFEWNPPYFTREIAERVGLDRPELKMAWFALRPPGQDAAKTDRLSQDLLVVSEPMLNKAGRTRFMVCGATGRFSLSGRLSDLPPECADFARLRRGMRIRVSKAEARGEGGMGLKAGSIMEIIE